MARFVVIALLASNPVTYLYMDAAKAMAKVRTLQRLTTAFELRDGATDAPMTVAELEARLR
jgi:hypothetical protein